MNFVRHWEPANSGDIHIVLEDRVYWGMSAEEVLFACLLINPWHMGVAAFGLRCTGTLGFTLGRIEFCIINISFVVRAFR